MISFRPTVDQWERLSAISAPHAKVFDSAFRRWKAGDICIGNTEVFERGAISATSLCKNPLQLNKDYDIPDSATARAILQAHLDKPVDHQQEISRLDREIAAMMGENAGVVAIDASTGKPINTQGA